MRARRARSPSSRSCVFLKTQKQGRSRTKKTGKKGEEKKEGRALLTTAPPPVTKERRREKYSQDEGAKIETDRDLGSCEHFH
ncbi:hypothetical protein U1Q18_014998 [Sarracenia purpurea var. burkii]